MNAEKDTAAMTLEQALAARISSGEVKKWLNEYALPFHELMAYYRCAMMKIETKFHILDTYFSLGNDCNHIESIHSRIKSPLSIIDKMHRLDRKLTVWDIEDELHDVAGVRVICSLVSDIYMLEKALLEQDDVRLVERKDYIANPKKNGYRSLHLIIETPIYLQDSRRMMKVEVQLRTLAMDTWASLEHKIRYKKVGCDKEWVNAELFRCSEVCADLDKQMELINSVNMTGRNDGEESELHTHKSE